MSLLRSLALCVLALIFTAPVARATVVNFNYAGVLTGPYSGGVSPGGPVFGTVTDGSPFSGTMSYDSAAPVAGTIGSIGKRYAGLSISLTIGGDTVSSSAVDVYVYSRNMGYPTDLMVVSGNSPTGTLGGLTPTYVSVYLQKLGGNVFPAADLPGTELDLSQFTLGNATFVEFGRSTSSAFISVRGDLTTGFVPEPATSALLLPTALLTLRRRQ
jgi:hypothetical protein